VDLNGDCLKLTIYFGERDRAGKLTVYAGRHERVDGRPA
jgi:hypothetical protein